MIVTAVSSAPGATLMHDAKRLRETLGLSNRDARSEAELLFMRALGVNRAKLIAYPELALEATSNKAYRDALNRRLAGEPIAYIFGEREFYGCEFAVSEAVLIPRPETELLVDMALARIDAQAEARVLDLGTGSGAIAVAIAMHRPNVAVTALDASSDALEMAQRNCARLLGRQDRVQLIRSDWFERLDGAMFDLIVSNPPYVADNDVHLESGDVRFEPRQALLGGTDGLDDLRRIIAAAPRHLAEGGWLLCEHGYDQARSCWSLMQQAGFSELVAERDLGGVLRVCGGRWLTRNSGNG